MWTNRLIYIKNVTGDNFLFNFLSPKLVIQRILYPKECLFNVEIQSTTFLGSGKPFETRLPSFPGNCVLSIDIVASGACFRPILFPSLILFLSGRGDQHLPSSLPCRCHCCQKSSGLITCLIYRYISTVVSSWKPEIYSDIFRNQ